MQERLSNPRKIAIVTSIMVHYNMQPPYYDMQANDLGS
jgi:hypothetical protein